MNRGTLMRGEGLGRTGKPRLFLGRHSHALDTWSTEAANPLQTARSRQLEPKAAELPLLWPERQEATVSI